MFRLNKMLFIVIALLLIKILFTKANESLINGLDLKYCDSSNIKKPISLHKMCEKKHKIFNSIDAKSLNLKNSDVLILDIYSKIQQEVYGTGYKCTKRVTQITYTKSFFNLFPPSTDAHTYNVDLTKQDCQEMHNYKICDKKTSGSSLLMKCNGDICWVKEEATEPWVNDWYFSGTRKRETYQCSIVPYIVTATHLKDHIFGTNCIPTDGFL